MKAELFMWMNRLTEIDPIEGFLFGLFLLLGILAVVSAVGNFDWFFRAREAKPLVKWLGRGGARIFYLILGILLMLASLVGFSGWKP